MTETPETTTGQSSGVAGLGVLILCAMAVYFLYVVFANVEGWLVSEPCFQCDPKQRFVGVQQQRLRGLNPPV